MATIDSGGLPSRTSRRQGEAHSTQKRQQRHCTCAHAPRQCVRVRLCRWAESGRGTPAPWSEPPSKACSALATPAPRAAQPPAPTRAVPRLPRLPPPPRPPPPRSPGPSKEPPAGSPRRTRQIRQGCRRRYDVCGCGCGCVAFTKSSCILSVCYVCMIEFILSV